MGIMLTPFVKVFGSVFFSNVERVVVEDSIEDESDSLKVNCESSTALIETPSLVTAFGGYKEGAMWMFGVYTLQSISTSDHGESVLFTSAAFSASMKKKRNESYQKTTLSGLVGKIAGRNGLKSKCTFDAQLEHVDQRGESDLALLQRFAKKYNAIFNIKGNTLIFMKKSQAPVIFFIFAKDAQSWNFKLSRRYLFETVKAKYHCTKKNKALEVKVGAGENEHLIQEQYKSKDEAKAMAQAKWEQLFAKTKTGSITLEGQNIIAGVKCVIMGFGKADDTYLITKVTHTADSTFTSTIELERAV